MAFTRWIAPIEVALTHMIMASEPHADGVVQTLKVPEWER